VASPAINILSKLKGVGKAVYKYGWRELGESGRVAMKRGGGYNAEIARLIDDFDNFSTQLKARSVESFSKYGPEMHAAPGLWKQAKGQLEHGVMAKDPSASLAALRAQMDMDLVYNEFIATGAKAAPRRLNYFPRMWDPNLFRGVHREKMIQHLQGTGQANSRLRAEDLLGRLGTGGKKFHNLETRRTLDLPGAREDVGVVLDYMTEANRRTSEVKFFGANDEKLEFLLSAAYEAGEDAEFARSVAQLFIGRPIGKLGRMVGFDKVSNSPIYQGIASFEAATKLGQAFIANATQPLNNVIRAGLRPTIRALVDTIADYGDAREFGIRSGAAYHQAYMEVRKQVGLEAGNIGEYVLRYTGFSWIEKFNRIFSANVGKQLAYEQFDILARNPSNNLAKATLRSIGVDVEEAIARKSLSQADLLNAGKRVSDQTQFRSTVMDVPRLWRRHPVMRILFMYKHFAFNQSKLIKDFVIKPAIYQREFRPLLYMSILYPAFGEVAADIKTLLRKGSLRDRPNSKYFLDRAIDNFAQVGSIGIFEDTFRSLTSGRIDRIATYALGPFASDVLQLVANIGAGDPGRAFGRQATRAIPVGGPLISRKLYPPRGRVVTPLRRGVVTKGAKNILRDLGLLEPRPSMFNK